MSYKHHYIYKITCLCGDLKGYYYIGKHSTRKEDAELDGYYGGGVIIRNYYEKYPPVLGKTITKEILEYNETKEENSKREEEIIGDLYLSDSKCLNLKRGGEGGNGQANKGKKHSKEQTENHSLFLKQYWRTHKPPRRGDGKVVDCFDDDGEFVGRFVTQELGGKVFGTAAINWGLQKGTNKQAGLRWRYAESMTAPMENIEPYTKPRKVMPEEAIEKMKKSKESLTIQSTRVQVIAISEDGTETIYNGIVEAATTVHPENQKAAQKNIQQAARGKRKIAYGYRWKYAD